MIPQAVQTPKLLYGRRDDFSGKVILPEVAGKRQSAASAFADLVNYCFRAGLVLIDNSDRSPLAR
jgi:hypothetical protein